MLYPQRPAELSRAHVENEFARILGRTADAEGSPSDGVWVALIREWNAFRAYLMGERSRVHYALSKDALNSELEKLDRFLREEITPPWEDAESRLSEMLAETRHRAALAARHGQHYFSQLEIRHKPLASVNADLRVKEGELVHEYQKLLATGEVTVSEQKMTLAKAQSFSVSADPALRRESFESTADWYLRHRERLAGLYGQQLTLRQQMAANLGDPDYIPLGYAGMGRTDYGAGEVAEFRGLIEKHAKPVLAEIHARQARELGSRTLKP